MDPDASDDMNVIALYPYNGTEAQGANPLEYDVNIWYQVSHQSRLWPFRRASSPTPRTPQY